MAGCALIFGDDAIAGLRLMKLGMELCPKDPNYFSYLTVAAYGHLFCDRPEKAVELAHRSSALNSEWDSTYWVLITAHTMLNCPDDAKATAAKFMTIYPEATSSHYENVLPIRNPKSRNLIIGCLIAAGIPE